MNQAAKIAYVLGKLIVIVQRANSSTRNSNLDILKNILLRVSGFTSSDWKDIKKYDRFNVSLDQVPHLFGVLKGLIGSKQDKAFALTMLNRYYDEIAPFTRDDHQLMKLISCYIHGNSSHVEYILNLILGKYYKASWSLGDKEDICVYEYELGEDTFISLKCDHDTGSIWGHISPYFNQAELDKIFASAWLMAVVTQSAGRVLSHQASLVSDFIADRWMITEHMESMIEGMVLNYRFSNIDIARHCKTFVQNSTVAERDSLLGGLINTSNAGPSMKKNKAECLRLISVFFDYYSSSKQGEASSEVAIFNEQLQATA